MDYVHSVTSIHLLISRKANLKPKTSENKPEVEKKE
jgi:hypothetical protein